MSNEARKGMLFRTRDVTQLGYRRIVLLLIASRGLKKI